MKSNNLLSVYLSIVFWHIGSSMIIPFVSIWLRNEIGTSSLLLIGLVIMLPNIIGILGISFFSNFTDKHGHYREVILLVNIVGVIEYLLLTQINNAMQYLLIVGIGALLYPSYYTITQAYATVICNPGEKGRITSNLMLFSSIGWFIGSSVAGNGFEKLGMSTMFLIASGFILAAGLAIMLSPPAEIKDREEKASKTSLLKLITRKSIILILLPMIILDLSAGAFWTLGSLFLFENIGISTVFIGYGNAIATLIGAIALLKIGPFTDKIGRKKVYLMGMILNPLFFVAISLNHNYLFVLFLWLIPLYIFIRPIVPAMVSDVTNAAERSRGMSLVTISSVIAQLGGLIIGAYIADNYSIGMDSWSIIPAIFSWLGLVFLYFKVPESLPIHSNT
ncbi:MAG: MFS transporter [Candidatus Heimdallarchaeota archaeon]|nr:MFS transporter [Candidatus Heimdallarchaeota archaeon]